MLDAVLFDLDGTITDPEVGITASYRHAFASVGHPIADDVDLRWMIGPPLRENLGALGLPGHLHDEAVAAYRGRHGSVGVYECELVPGMVEVLDDLVADGVPLALATAKALDQAVATLEHLGLADRLPVVAAGNHRGVPRQKAEIVAEALALLGGPDPARVAMVGDRFHDVAAARANGCLAVAVTWGFAQQGELEAAGPDRVVATPAELLAVLRSA